MDFSMRKGRFFIGFCLSLLLIGCDVSDPQKGGFIGGVVGDLSGAYKGRIEQRKQALLAAERSSEQAQKERSKLEETVTEKGQRALTLQLEVAAIRDDLSKLESDLHVIQGQKRSDQEAIRAAEMEVAMLRDHLDKFESKSNTKASHSELQAARLRDELSELRDLVEELDETHSDF